MASSLPMARLRLAPRGAVSLRVDGAWWPRSHHLLAELPSLISALPPEWGKIVTVTVNTQMWAEAPGRILVGHHVVRLRGESAWRRRHTVGLFQPDDTRRDLLVVPPELAPADAEYLMAAVASYDP
ncbi:hypothetical protein Stsp02_62890 [Streptomyces sp. NBRC 14336]|uniref:DUF5994 family protein n=1 Tax=Streptomyces sp. NBRC 14336 TaxID=3030992 RepID=UPI0024A1CA0E|nr:DUF5994 family protein [Streptomyces sp. NBRC 14336]WBO79302.1 DUF5994 family protein [Streptomyces sp. SBE_14.2]GLW50628.1 hypothetical protein Stsp02_62890 [Streptomyces sp. NBRC 14336]